MLILSYRLSHWPVCLVGKFEMLDRERHLVAGGVLTPLL